MVDAKQLPVYKNPSVFWLWLILAQFSLLTTLNLPYQGEEAVYTITSLEMAFNHEWYIPTLYGENYARPPLLNWLIIPVAYVLGWDHLLIASRLVTLFATFFTTLVLLWLVQKLFKNRSLSLFSALVYMSGDVLFRRGWLAYADPFFSFFTFSAIACLWVALLEKRSIWLYLAALSLIASFLTKAITGYIFYGIAMVVLYWRHSERAFLLKPISLMLHMTSLLFPLIWNIFISDGAHAHGMIHDVVAKLNLDNLRNYLMKVAFYPLDTIIRWLPVSVFILYFLAQRIIKQQSVAHLLNMNAMTAVFILGLNYIPYWLAPESHMRYLMPLYPLLALVLTYVVWQLGEQKIKIVFVWLIVGIVIRYAIGIWGLPYYEKYYRGNYQAVAKDILSFVQDNPLYANDYSATGLSMIACLDVLRIPKPPLKKPDQSWTDGFLISHTPEVLNTKVSKIYHLGHHPIYLLCRGSTCRSED